MSSLDTRPYAEKAETKPKVVAVRAAHLFDGVSGLLSGPVTVSVTAGRITAVTQGRVDVKDAKVIDLGDVTLMPGLIDVHKHMDNPPHLNISPYESL